MSKLDMPSELLDALQKLSTLLESEDALDKTLHTVVELSVGVLPGCDAAGVTVRVDGEDKTAAASDDFTREIDAIQYATNEGPCLTALETSVIQRLEVDSGSSDWPEFTRRAAEKGLKGVLSFPLESGGSKAALNLYAMNPRAFDESTLAAGQIFAKQTSIALHNAETYVAARLLSDQLNEALKSRDLIGQAKGILMEREGVSDTEAFEMLKTISQSANVKLRDIAQRLIEEKRSEAK